MTNSNKSKSGRKPLPDAVRLSHKLQAAVTKREAEAVSRAARKSKLTVSEYIRETVMLRIRSKSKE